MTTQSYLTDMQALNSAASQQVNQVQQISNSQQVQSTLSQKVLPAHTIIQPSQATYNGQQFIVTITGDQNGEHETIQLPHGAAGQVIYQPQQSYSDYTNQGSMYTSVTGAYYQNQGSTPQMSSGIGGIQGQIITHGGESYLVQGSVLEGDGQGLSHNIRASPASVQWLMDNYETAEGVSLPRGTLYGHYLQHCQDHKLEPMNPASFGKLIRSVFLGLRTRRLGTRGNSQYHYYGIRIKSTSQLNHLPNDHFLASRQNSMNPAKRFRASYDGRESSSSMTDGSPVSQPPLSVPTTQQQQHQQFLGDASAAMPEFGHINLLPDQLPPGLSQKHLLVFEELYKDHCEAFLEIIVNLHFHLVETLWMSFWKSGQGDPECEEMEQRLPKEKLFALCELPAVRQYVLESDYAFYQALVQVLIPDVLRPIPGSLTQAIRNFAKSLESWLKNSMSGVPDEMIKTKINAVSAFAQILRRYTSLNHLAQAARAVLQNSAQISQMLADINKVDFSNVQEQASWVCQCDDDTVHQLEEDFKKTLQHQTSLEQWASWLEDVVNQALSPHEASPDFAKAARQFLLKWSFYSSMVIRDLTLRSAASFGSFHLIRLLYDEYMFYLVEHKVAAATGETSIAVMGKVRQLHDSENWSSCGSLSNGDAAVHHQRAGQMLTRTPGGSLLVKTGDLDSPAGKPTNTAINLAQSSSLSSAGAPHPVVASQFQDSVISTMSTGAGFFLQPLVTSACHQLPPQRASLMTISDSSAHANKAADMMPLSGAGGGGVLINGQAFIKLARTS